MSVVKCAIAISSVVPSVAWIIQPATQYSTLGFFFPTIEIGNFAKLFSSTPQPTGR